MDERIQVYETKMGKTLNALESELTTIRAGRANPHILDTLIIMEHQLRSSRLLTFPYQRRV